MELCINIIILMPKAKKSEKKVCNDHTFTLKPEGLNCYYQTTVTVKMCLNQTEGAFIETRHLQNCYEGPIFNKDRNLAMPSFILNSEKNKYLINVCKGRNENENKYYQNEEKSEMLIPKPNSRTYCNVCKEKYDDYRDHILSFRHKQKIRANSFNKDILLIQQKYNQTRKDLQPKEKESTQFSNLIIIDDDEQEREQLGQPRKLVKLNPPQDSQEHLEPENYRKSLQEPWRGFGYFPPPPYCPNYYGGFPALPHIPYYNTQVPPFSLNFNYNIHVLGPPMNFMDPRSVMMPPPNMMTHPQSFSFPKPPINPINKSNFIVVEDDKE